MLSLAPTSSIFFFFNDTATTEIYTLSLHDALPISSNSAESRFAFGGTPRSLSISSSTRSTRCSGFRWSERNSRSEEHTSELQSRLHLVCRLLLEKKKQSRPPAPRADPPAPRVPRRR